MSGDVSTGEHKFDQASPDEAIEPKHIQDHSMSYGGAKHGERFELLIFSEAGKPIYSYSKREDAVTLMPLCSALINYAKKAQREPLQTIRTSDDLIIHFTTRSPLVIIVIHEVNSYVDHLMLVEQVEAQVISILTAKTLNSLFEDRPTFDLKRLLYGSEKLIDATTNLSAFPVRLFWPWLEAFLSVNSSTQHNPPASSNSAKNQAPGPAMPLRPLRVLVPLAIMHPGTRDTIHGILQGIVSSNSKNMVFSLLFRIERPKYTSTASVSEPENEELSTTAITVIGEDSSETSISHSDSNQTNFERTENFRLMAVCSHHERHKIKIADIHIILALLTGSRAQLKAAESLWMPICLPKFNQDAFVHSYIARINEGQHCLVLVNIDREEFSNCQKAKNMIEERLESLIKEPNLKSKLHYQPSPLVNSTLVGLQDRLVSLRRDRSSNSDEIADVEQQAQRLNLKQELYQARQLQFFWYQTGRHVLWWQRSSSTPMNSLIYYVTKKMLQSSLKHLWLKQADETIVLGWHVPTFQLYAQFDGTTTTDEATEVIQRITNWIKKEEDNFSIKDYR